jgi:hypothetical protein
MKPTVRYCDKCCTRPALPGGDLCKTCQKAEDETAKIMDRDETKPHGWREAFNWRGRK